MGDIDEAVALLGDLSSKDRRTCIELMIKLLGNVVRHPDDPKYRQVEVPCGVVLELMLVLHLHPTSIYCMEGEACPFKAT